VALDFEKEMQTSTLGLRGGLSEEDRVILRSSMEFIVKCMMPNFLHIIPVANNPVFNLFIYE
jgi:hypothetical protein